MEKKDDILCANNYINYTSIVLVFLLFTLSSVCQAHFIVSILHIKISQIEIHPFITFLVLFLSVSLPYKHLAIHYSMRI